MTNQAQKLQELAKTAPKIASKTKFIAITSGKGGVGKSTVSANLGNTLAKLGYKTCLFDADIGLANLDVILNVKTPKNLLHVLKGEASLEEIVMKIDENLYLIPGESGDEILKYGDSFMFERFLDESKFLDDIDYMIIDTGAGIGDHIQVFLNAADEVIVVTVPDPAAITDAYATVKITSKIKNTIYMVMNMVKNEKEAAIIFDKIKKIAQSNIGEDLNLELLGKLSQDQDVAKSVKQRVLFTNTSPNSLPSLDMQNIVKNIIYKTEQKVLKNRTSMGFGAFIKRLIEQF